MKKLLSLLSITTITTLGANNVVSCNKDFANSNSLFGLEHYLLVNNNGQGKEMLYKSIGLAYAFAIDKMLGNINNNGGYDEYYYYNDHNFYAINLSKEDDQISDTNYLLNIDYDKKAQNYLTEFGDMHPITPPYYSCDIGYTLKGFTIIQYENEYYKVLGDNNFQKVDENSW